MSKPNIILIGAGGHAQACIDVIEQQGQYEIAGLVGAQHELNAQSLGYSVIGTDDNLAALARQYQNVLIAIGQIKSAGTRIRLYQRVVELGFNLPSIISSTAYVSPHAHIGAGSIVMHGAIVNAGAYVGENCIINSRALIEHHAVVKNHCHISTGVILNGDVKVSQECFVGSGSVVKQGVSIGKGCIVGMGLFLRHDLADGARFVGGNKT